MPKYTECYDGETLNTFTTIGSDNSLLNYSGRKYVIYWKSLFQDIFMPRGYPQSVSPDYASYQLWDTVQAFASSMNSALATEAVLRGAGVGNEAASTMAAAIAWLLRDGIGMIARILFAWFYSPYLDADCKQWRLVADCFNDLASCLDLITPIFPNLFTLIICLSSMLRAVVGVAGSATRTTVTNHQAISDNVGDVAAKDGSQETLVNVFALLCSLLLLPIVSGNVARVWLLFALFTLIHLYGNYRAVKSLQFRTLNQSLLRIIVKNHMETKRIGTVSEINNEESVLFHWNSLRRYYGCRLSDVLFSSNELSFRCSKFRVIHDLKTNCGYVSMAKMSDTADQLRAALCMELMLNTKTVPSSAELNEFVDKLKEGGWLINKHRLVFDRWTYCEK
uniref:Protein root UVB sensitive/RUS domain-containing protein n=1 Tax=Setaria digitata TaxID=48799 RepID=A0A915Q620_9BILA